MQQGTNARTRRWGVGDERRGGALSLRGRSAIRWPLAFAAIGLVACTIANGLIIPPTPAGPDAGDGGDGCEHALLPTRPIEPDGFLETPLVFAMDQVTFGSKDAGTATVGYDLDNACTCSPHPETCVPRTGAPPHCDAPGGRDNSIAAITGTFTGPFSIEAYINKQLAGGNAGLLITISGYNGLADDANISIGLLPSIGRFDRATDGGTGMDKITDGGKRWSYDPNFDQKTNLANAIQFFGYVRDHVAVAITSSGNLPLAGLDISLSKGFFVAPIKMNPPRIEDGVLGGRWPLSNVAASVGRFSLEGFGIPGKLCQTDYFTQKFLPALCAASDIAANEADDGKGKPCDALSVAFTFHASEAEKGDPIPLPQVGPCFPLLPDGGQFDPGDGGDAGLPPPVQCP